jgi:hypothetical protein
MLLDTANVVPSSPILITLMMEAIISPETLVLTRAERRNIQEDGNVLKNTHIYIYIYIYMSLYSCLYVGIYDYNFCSIVAYKRHEEHLNIQKEFVIFTSVFMRRISSGT